MTRTNLIEYIENIRPNEAPNPIVAEWDAPAQLFIRLLENLLRHLVLIFKLGHYRRAGLLAK